MQLSSKAFILCCFCVLLAMAGCTRSANQPGATSPTTNVKRYHLRGKIVSIDKRANLANIDGEEIPGFMGAMTMPYVVKPASELDKLAPGDAITADVAVQDENSWIENVTVTAHATSTTPSMPK